MRVSNIMSAPVFTMGVDEEQLRTRARGVG
jgi:hypothetical protein